MPVTDKDSGSSTSKNSSKEDDFVSTTTKVAKQLGELGAKIITGALASSPIITGIGFLAGGPFGAAIGAGIVLGGCAIGTAVAAVGGAVGAVGLAKVVAGEAINGISKLLGKNRQNGVPSPSVESPPIQQNKSVESPTLEAEKPKVLLNETLRKFVETKSTSIAKHTGPVRGVARATNQR